MKNVSRTDLPSYACHKIVRAAKILRVDQSIPCLVVEIDGEERGLLPASEDYWARARNAGETAGYYVLYGDGYESWSPTEAFEDGYTRTS